MARCRARAGSAEGEGHLRRGARASDAPRGGAAPRPDRRTRPRSTSSSAVAPTRSCSCRCHCRRSTATPAAGGVPAVARRLPGEPLLLFLGRVNRLKGPGRPDRVRRAAARGGTSLADRRRSSRTTNPPPAALDSGQLGLLGEHDGGSRCRRLERGDRRLLPMRRGETEHISIGVRSEALVAVERTGEPDAGRRTKSGAKPALTRRAGRRPDRRRRGSSGPRATAGPPRSGRRGPSERLIRPRKSRSRSLRPRPSDLREDARGCRPVSSGGSGSGSAGRGARPPSSSYRLASCSVWARSSGERGASAGRTPGRRCPSPPPSGLRRASEPCADDDERHLRAPRSARYAAAVRTVRVSVRARRRSRRGSVPMRTKPRGRYFFVRHAERVADVRKPAHAHAVERLGRWRGPLVLRRARRS